MAYKSMEQERGCGWREVGGVYAVSSGGTVGGTIQTDCNFVILPEYIPLPKDVPDPGRGFAYVDGEAILTGKPGEEWRISPPRAELLKLMWNLFGLYEERRIDDLEWAEGSAERWPDQAQALIGAVEDLREKHGDCPLVPAIMEVRRLRWLGPIHNRPADTLAALWRLITEVSWVGDVPRVMLDTVASIMKAMRAEADVPLLEKFYVETGGSSGNEPDL